jgi:hypothetical protein
MPKKRIYLRDLEKFDRENDECSVRSLEMTVDAATRRMPGYTIQFWTDVRVYGLDEAILFLERTTQADPEELQILVKEVEDLKSRMFGVAGAM